MNAKQRDSLVALLREFVNLIEENSHMALILDKAEVADLRVPDWRAEVERLRSLQTPVGTRASTMRGLIDSFQRAHDKNSLTALIERMRQGKPN
jgi:hypothetical protein